MFLTKGVHFLSWKMFPLANPLSDCVRELMGPRDVIIVASGVAVLKYPDGF